MAYLHPIEAITGRMNEIPVSDGNLILDIIAKKIHFDSRYGERIEITSIEFFDTESELLSSVGIPNKIFIAKDSNAMYYYDGNWKSVKVTSREQSVSNFYLSDTGSDSNNGLTLDTPMKTFVGLLKKYSNINTFNITVSGDVSSGETSMITVKDKTIYINGSDNTIDILNDTLTFAHCFVYLSSITINQVFGNDNTSFITNNCNVQNGVFSANNSELIMHSCSVTGNIEASNNSRLTIRDSSITGSLNSSYGAVITMNNSTYNNTYNINGGRIYIDSATDVATQDEIDSTASTIDVLSSEPVNPPVGYMYIVST